MQITPDPQSSSSAPVTPATGVDSVFHFDDPIAFLNAQLLERQRRNPRFSLRAWATQLGYRNPSLLFQVLRRERRLKMELAMKLAANLNLQGKALRYFELIVLNGTSQSETERRVFEANLAKLRPRKFRKINPISLDVFTAASEWYHWAIMALLDMPDFTIEPGWLQSRLGQDLDKRTLRAAVERLMRLGLLVRAEDGKYKRMDGNNDAVWMFSQVPSDAIRTYHTQMIDKSRDSVQQQSVDERYLRATTVAFSQDNLAKAVEIIEDAHKELMALAQECGRTDDLYQMNTQFFRLTQKSPERKK
jgi:uncharacterized protein (TIGR02147 family)